MAHYVMGDIHGEADRFHAMLERIHLSEEDTLILLGDVIDRGPDGIALLLEIMEMPNAIMLLGNHEYMMLQYLSPDATGIEIRRWNKNGNAPTLAAYLKQKGKVQQRIIAYLRSIPNCRLIIGHTKVLSLIQPEEKRIKHALDLENRGEHLNILYAPGFINLDCGCGYNMPIKALACIRLEDMVEYYI